MASPAVTESVKQRLLRLAGEYAWLAAGSLLALLIVTLTASTDESAERQRNRARIEQMSRSERDRLKVNQQHFDHLTPEQLQQVRTIHHAVSHDPALDQTLVAWHAWLGSLPLEARDKLLQIKDPQERMEEIRRLRKPRFESPSRHPYEVIRRMREFSVALPREDFVRVMRSAAAYFKMPDEPPEQKLAVQLDYYLRIVDEIFRKGRETGSANGDNRFRPRFQLPEDLRTALLSPIESSKAKADFERVPNRPITPSLIVGIVDESLRLAAQQGPAKEDLADFVKGLDEAARRELNDFPKDQKDAAIRYVWLRQTYRPQAEKLDQAILALFPFFNWGREESSSSRSDGGRRFDGGRSGNPFDRGQWSRPSDAGRLFDGSRSSGGNRSRSDENDRTGKEGSRQPGEDSTKPASQSPIKKP